MPGKSTRDYIPQRHLLSDEQCSSLIAESVKTVNVRASSGIPAFNPETTVWHASSTEDCMTHSHTFRLTVALGVACLIYSARALGRAVSVSSVMAFQRIAFSHWHLHPSQPSPPQGAQILLKKNHLAIFKYRLRVQAFLPLPHGLQSSISSLPPDLAIIKSATPRPGTIHKARARKEVRKTLYSPHWGFQRRQASGPLMMHRGLRELQDIRKAQTYLIRQILQTTSRLADSEGDLGVEEEDPIPGSDWTLDAEEQSQQLISRHSHAGSSSQDPYTPLLESQIEAAIIGGGKVVGRPTCVSHDAWVENQESTC
ncbi:hypothetical protein B0H19DRAFT_1072590 [Mycena capillaripes]|nr:hypothetical protein B0H19DRAFT_1072590 [Mycena capillaripes]